MSLGRADAIDRIEEIVSVVETEVMPVPVRELWVYGDVALGLDPLDRVNVYLKKDILLTENDPDPALVDRYGIEGIGSSVRADWAAEHPEYIRANDNGYAAPERCLGAHLLAESEPFHLEVCNTGFEDNVTQRLEGARARGVYEEILDPRGVCLWMDGHRSPTAFEKLRTGGFVFPTLAESLELLGMEPEEALTAADVLQSQKSDRAGRTIRGDVV